MLTLKHGLAGLLAAMVAVGRASAGAHPVRSVTDLDALKAQAHRSKRLVMVSITSSDPGCWQCKKIGKEFFADREFTAWMDRHAVYGEIDLVTKSRSARDSMLGAVYAAHGAPVPSLMLLHPDGRLLDRAPREYWATSQVVTNFRAIYAREMGGAAEANASAAGSDHTTPGTADATWAPSAAKPVHYPGLKLKSITGRGQRRFALINDQTLMPGETAKVTSDGTRRALKLLEIRDESVLVRVEGEPGPRTLRLNSKP